MDYSFSPIGVVHSPFREKFGIPRQPLLVPEARARLELFPPYDRAEAFAGLEAFSHIWLTFVFHQTMRAPWRPGVRPPRLGGNRRVGVFASRSPFRPNPLGLSVVALDDIVQRRGRVELRLSGIDLLDGTPVLDIKPYLPYADAVSASGGYAPEAPPVCREVRFSETASAQLQRREDGAALRRLIVKLLACDPRPAYKKDEPPSARIYGMRLQDFDLKWRLAEEWIEVIALAPVEPV